MNTKLMERLNTMIKEASQDIELVDKLISQVETEFEKGSIDNIEYWYFLKKLENLRKEYIKTQYEAVELRRKLTALEVI